jgi:hypothetical protein
MIIGHTIWQIKQAGFSLHTKKEHMKWDRIAMSPAGDIAKTIKRNSKIEISYHYFIPNRREPNRKSKI